MGDPLFECRRARPEAVPRCTRCDSRSMHRRPVVPTYMWRLFPEDDCWSPLDDTVSAQETEKLPGMIDGE
ncbi:hypothetical protein GCM10017771_14690 [Streptomyces capitiformicae]|uniref:Uncharacterized protein n=1 Tax=Streptomyces capitiformicae TaxID=2014920 RepID=A0A919GIG9_9ACTN|nr:hypothetical protein GCM10017771_14690 [Streptomyces capitiformicae]